MHNFLLEYLFNGEPRRHVLEVQEAQLAEHEAAMHLLELHVGDAENGLIMPPADATPEQILQQAEIVGITQIRVVKQTA
ncbi:hypothetical protein [Pseudomonas sp. TH15]|uniref:hypothetical protein n=1 Tax=Pseudomonas sp. TH15 TaxID=2796381 RepID=UPI001912E519|nr:hypothetical protein [Pseudomonas sp. TH15]MBK5512574.1 hypothetical protein [Pseudomonas sp. TH15]